MVARRREECHKDLKCWKWLEDALEFLGPDGMSSDDSDDDGGMPVNRVRNMPWRNEKLTSYLEVLDDLKQAYEFSTRGAKKVVRTRSDNHRTSERSHVICMPVALYDEHWLAHARKHPNIFTLVPSQRNMPFLDFVPILDGEDPPSDTPESESEEEF